MTDHLKNQDLALVAEDRAPARAVPPAVSAVIVTYNPRLALFKRVLTPLAETADRDTEIVVIDNSDRVSLAALCRACGVRHVKMKQNVGLTVGRNIATLLVRSEIVVFLDDDGIPGPELIARHRDAYRSETVCGLRGRARPRTASVYNLLQSHYDLGARARPYPLNLECNISLRRRVLVDVGGFNADVRKGGGHEGLELSYRIAGQYGADHSLLYVPDAVIYHDYADSFRKYVRKMERHRVSKAIFTRDLPGLFDYYDSFPRPPPGHPEAGPVEKLRIHAITKAAACLLALRRRSIENAVRASGCRGQG